MEKIICVVGPTASGKTKLAVELAKKLDGEVLSCDSMQIYRHMDIGTAKPTVEEMRGIPHHMIDVVEPDERFSVGKYVEMADIVLQDILNRGKTAIVAGGTGLYADSLILGRSFAPIPSSGKREALEARMETEGAEALLRELAAVDAETAAKLHPADRKRIIRALEVYEETGRPISEHDRETRSLPPKYEALWLGLDFSDRTELYRRIDLRVERMMTDGLLNELDRLLDAGVSPCATAMQAIGYKELLAYRRGEGTLEEAVALIQQRSRNYAKRQLTWFRRNSDVHWLRRSEAQDFDEIISAACQLLP